tara:strand:- start:269 stop:505 length:237 start_codon:yes stop_codon:yes gene_type:complete
LLVVAVDVSLMHLLPSALVDMVVAEDQQQQIMLAVVVAVQVIVMDLAVKLQDLLALAAVAVVGVRPLMLSVLVVQVLL